MTFKTSGERLLGRALRIEKRGGVDHFKPGQHHATWIEGEEGRCALVGYVDSMGHAVLLACLKDEHAWKALMFTRAGQTHVMQRQVDATGKPLPPPVRRALDDLERRDR